MAEVAACFGIREVLGKYSLDLCWKGGEDWRLVEGGVGPLVAAGVVLARTVVTLGDILLTLLPLEAGEALAGVVVHQVNARGVVLARQGLRGVC